MGARPLAILVLLAACNRESAIHTALSDSSRAPTVEPGTVAGGFALQLWELRPGITLAQWKSSHPDEAISGEDSAGAGAWLGDWCAAAQKTLPAGTRQATRTALFYPPDPGDLSLPDSANDLVGHCILGAILVQATTASAAAADSLDRALASAFGPPSRGPVRATGAALWTRPARFRRGDVAVLSGLRGSALEAVALLPLSGVSLDSAQPGRFALADTVPLDSVVANARLDTASYHALLRLDAARAKGPASMRRAATLARPLARWVAAGNALAPPRRAAALYVADRLLDRDMCAYRLCDDENADARGQLAVLGARFTMFDEGWSYDRSWLAQARALDRDSPLGQRILLEQLGHGFNFSGSCPAGGELFRRVISEGERYLARMPAAPVAPEVHVLVGEAYGDIVALAHGAGGLEADTSRYGVEAGPAARAALLHYRAAMSAGPHDPVAMAAWRRAWWLKAGLAPRGLRFYCVEPGA